MPNRRSIEEVVKEVASALKALGVEYVIVGGIAATSWGNIRTTLDVDVVMNIKEKDAESLSSELQKRGFRVSKEEIIGALKDRSHFTALDDRSLIRLDGKGAYGSRELESLRTRRKIILGETEYYIASPEDMIANKLLSGSEQDIRDAEGIYVRQMDHLDEVFLRKTAKKLGVSEKLEKLERRVGRRIADLSTDKSR
jgi:hypothetical protein